MCSAHRVLLLWVWTPDTLTFMCLQLILAVLIWTPTPSPSKLSQIEVVLTTSQHQKPFLTRFMLLQSLSYPPRLSVSVSESLSYLVALAGMWNISSVQGTRGLHINTSAEILNCQCWCQWIRSIFFFYNFSQLSSPVIKNKIISFFQERWQEGINVENPAPESL